MKQLMKYLEHNKLNSGRATKQGIQNNKKMFIHINKVYKRKAYIHELASN